MTMNSKYNVINILTHTLGIYLELITCKIKIEKLYFFLVMFHVYEIEIKVSSFFVYNLSVSE